MTRGEIKERLLKECMVMDDVEFEVFTEKYVYEEVGEIDNLVDFIIENEERFTLDEFLEGADKVFVAKFNGKFYVFYLNK